MLKGIDIVMALELANAGEGRTVRAIAADLGLDVATVHRSMKRLEQAWLWNPASQSIMRNAVRELVVHGVRYVFPVRLGGPSRGVATAWSAPPLAAVLADVGEKAVWPDPTGKVRGLAVEPLHPVVPELAKSRPDLGELLALVDGLRLGDARIRALAIEQFDKRFLGDLIIA